MHRSKELATLGGGCFWCLDAVYRGLRGVLDVRSGYAGGRPDNPSYELVCTGTTGHAEVVQVTFDPELISFRELLDIFFVVHDPTTLNRQGADVGTQYRSVIYYHSPKQNATAQSVIAAVDTDDAYDNPVVTEVSPAPEFHIAEDYHQDYFAKNPGKGYCQAVVAPKVAKARKEFFERYAQP